MISAVLTGVKKVEVRRVPDPQIHTEREVLLRIMAVGICGSDIQYYLTGRIGDQAVQYPFTVGHECAAVVEKVGGSVTKVKSGDRVVINPAVTCGKCDQCLRGRSNTCRNLLFLGSPGQLEGCLSEYIVIPQTNCYPIKKEIELEEATLVEPLSIGIYAVTLLKDYKAQTIGILGSGPIGLSVALAAQDSGIRKVYMTDKIDRRLEAARKVGALWAGNPDKSDVVSDILSRESLQLDAVFECCGDQQAINQAVELLKPGGRLMVVGIPNTDRITFDPHRIRRKEISIKNVRRQEGCIPAAVDLIEKRRKDIAFIVTHRFSLKEAQAAFDLVANYRGGVIKAVVRSRS